MFVKVDKRKGKRRQFFFKLFRNVNFEQPTLHTRGNEEHLAEATLREFPVQH